MIQDIFPHKLINHYDPDKTPKPDSLVMHFKGNEVLLFDDPSVVRFPTAALLEKALIPGGSVQILSAADDSHSLQIGVSEPSLLPERSPQETGKQNPSHLPLRYLFSIDSTDLFLLEEDEIAVPEGYAYRNARTLRSMELGPREMIYAEFTGHQLYRWYKDNRYCGTCGSKTEHSKTERAMVCPKCGRTIYPRILPAVIVAVRNGDKILMTKYANRPLAFYALVAGFTEIGETLEETVEREVMEEVGLKVKNIRYYKSQPWGVADDILMGFYCDLDGDDTIRLDESELKEGRWFTREEVELQPTDFSLTNEMMLMFKEGRL